MRYFYIFILTLFFISFKEDGYAKTENSYNNYTLIVMLGDQLLDNNLHFKDKEKCKYFANRMNNHPPIPNKEGKMEKMNAYCKSINSLIEIPKLNLQQIWYLPKLTIIS